MRTSRVRMSSFADNAKARGRTQLRTPIATATTTHHHTIITTTTTTIVITYRRRNAASEHSNSGVVVAPSGCIIYMYNNTRTIAVTIITLLRRLLRLQHNLHLSERQQQLHHYHLYNDNPCSSTRFARARAHR